MIKKNLSMKTKNSLYNYISDQLFLSFLLLCIIIFILLKYVFSFFGFNSTDIDSARYMISTLIQSEATIFAIVISLSLIAVQQASSSYSTRVIRIFKSNPNFLILIFIYIITIVYGVWVLKSISPLGTSQDLVHSLRNFSHTIFFSSFEDHILFYFSLSICSFLALVPYLLNILNLLDPSTIIDILSRDITKDNLFSLNESSKIAIDPVLPIIDIINSSLLKYDYETAKYGLDVIENRIICVINEIDNESDEIGKKLLNSIHFFEDIAQVAANLKNEESASYAIMSIGEIGAVLTQKEFDDTTKKVVNELRNLGILLARQKSAYAAVTSIESLENINSVAEQKMTSANLAIICEIIIAIGSIGQVVVRNKIHHQNILNAFKNTANVIKEKNIQDEALITFYILSIFGLASSALKHCDIDDAKQVFQEIYYSLNIIIKLSYELKLADPCKMIKLNLEDLKKTIESDPRYMSDPIYHYIRSLLGELLYFVKTYLKSMGIDPDEPFLSQGTLHLKSIKIVNYS